jgi:Na+/melibiose symporter-like transporter
MLNIILLGITSLLTDISSEMIYPLLPIFLVIQLGASPAVLGLVEGIAESMASLVKVFSGYFSDKIKSRRPFAAGYSFLPGLQYRLCPGQLSGSPVIRPVGQKKTFSFGVPVLRIGASGFCR